MDCRKYINVELLAQAYREQGVEVGSNFEHVLNQNLIMIRERIRYMSTRERREAVSMKSAGVVLRSMLKGSTRTTIDGQVWFVVNDEMMLRAWTEDLYAPKVPEASAELHGILDQYLRMGGTPRLYEYSDFYKMFPKRLGVLLGAARYCSGQHDENTGGVFSAKPSLKCCFPTRSIVNSAVLFGAGRTLITRITHDGSDMLMSQPGRLVVIHGQYGKTPTNGRNNGTNKGKGRKKKGEGRKSAGDKKGGLSTA